MGSKINPKIIVLAHVRTLCDFGTKKINYLEVILFYALPILVGVIVYLLFDRIGPALANNLIATFSIFVGLLLNLLLIVYDLVKKGHAEKDKDKDKDGTLKTEFLREIFANISYCILIGIVILFFLLLSFIPRWYLPDVSAVCVYFLCGNFFLTLLMVLKRIYLLLEKEFET